MKRNGEAALSHNGAYGWPEGLTPVLERSC